MTEPDIVLLTEVEVCVSEHKFRCQKEPWAAQGDGWTNRWRDYRTHGFDWLPDKPDHSHRCVYQLVRNAIYAKLLAERLGKQHAKVVSLVSRRRCQSYPGLERQYEAFRAMPVPIVVDPLRFWENLHQKVVSSVSVECATKLSLKMKDAFTALG